MKKGHLYIVSTGPGGILHLTIEAQKAIEASNVVVGYTKYIEDITPLIQNKKVMTSGMTEEISRCDMAISSAIEGNTVSLVSNGDVNVFGLASIAIELIDTKKLWDQVEITSLPGVTSFLALASKTGAPISQDFAIISLSDRLTPLDVIEKRIKAGMEGDFVLGIYNPLSKRRKKPYELFLSYVDQYIKKETPVIIASNIDRQMEEIHYLTAEKLLADGIENPLISMSTLLLIGNQSTRWTENNKLLTPRGYLDKYHLDGKMK